MIMHSDRDWISIAEQVCVEKNSAKLAVFGRAALLRIE